MHVESFDSYDAMQAAMAAAEDNANRDLTPGQIALRDDTENTRYFARALPDIDLVVYGRVESVGTLRKQGVDFDPVDNRERGYLTGTGYSADLSDGEPGDTHVSQVVPITAAIFYHAQALGWPRYSQLTEEGNLILARGLAKCEAKARTT